MSHPGDPPLLKRAFRKEFPRPLRFLFAATGLAVGGAVATLHEPRAVIDLIPPLLVLLGLTAGLSSGWSP